MAIGADVDHVNILAEIEAKHREAILAQCTMRKFKTGQMIWNEGDHPRFIAFIVEGKAISMYHAPNGRVGATGIWAAGDVLGGASIYQPRERQTAVKCLEPTVIYCLGLEKTHAITHQYPEVGTAIINALSARLRWANHLTHILQTLPASERVAGLLLSLAQRFSKQTPEGIVIDVGLTHEDVAALLGVTRQFATITLHDLQDRKVIALRRRSIIVTDIQRLRELVLIA